MARMRAQRRGGLVSPQPAASTPESRDELGWAQIAAAFPSDMSGMRVLDIGCNSGFYSIALAQRGARVVGIDSDPHCLHQARQNRDRLGLAESQLTLLEMQVYELARTSGAFDVVLLLGVLHHLRYPLLALDVVAEKVRGLLVVQTSTNSWSPNRACVLATLRATGLEPVSSPAHEIEVARRTRPAVPVPELRAVFP